MIIDNLAIPPIIVCIGFECLPNNSLNTFLSADDVSSPIDIMGLVLLVASVNAVLFTKKLGISNMASEGLSNLKPFGILAEFNTPSTILSASISDIVFPGLAVAKLSLNRVLAFSTASAAGLYLSQGIILFSCMKS